MNSLPLLRDSPGRTPRSLTVGLGVFILASSGTAQDSVHDGLYFSADLGATFIQDTTVRSSDPFTLDGKMKFEPGARLDVALGYQFGSLAVEVEVGILANSTDSPADEFGGRTDFTYYQVPILVNFLWQIPTRSRIHPYLGAGIGGVEATLEDYDLFYGTSESAFGFAWQGVAGCRFQISSSVDLGVSYKYLGTTDRTYDALSLRIKGTHSHSVVLSVSMKF